MDTRTLFDDFLMKEVLAGRFDDFLTTNFLTIFLFEDLSGRRTSRYRQRPGFSSPSMPLLVFWPHAGAWGAGVILPPCAQHLWCEWYVMKIIQKKNVRSKISSCYSLVVARRISYGPDTAGAERGEFTRILLTVC